jgi:acyl-CoA thioesterase-2
MIDPDADLPPALAPDHAQGLAADLALLGLERDPGDPEVVRFELAPHLCRHDGVLFGGTALAATLAAFELVSGRPSLWATVQFVGRAVMADLIECRVVVAAHGRSVDQLQLTASVDGEHLFTSVGSTATRRPDGISGSGRTMPDAPPPEACERFGPAAAVAAASSTTRPFGESVGHHAVSEFREVPAGPGGTPGHVLMWARVTGRVATSAAKLGFLADMVPIAICRAAGVEGAGTSLDNSLRVGRLVDTEWVLVELEAHAADGGYGWGVSHMWAPDGTLMATGSQTAKLFSFESFFQRLAAVEGSGPS